MARDGDATSAPADVNFKHLFIVILKEWGVFADFYCNPRLSYLRIPEYLCTIHTYQCIISRLAVSSAIHVPHVNCMYKWICLIVEYHVYFAAKLAPTWSLNFFAGLKWMSIIDYNPTCTYNNWYLPRLHFLQASAITIRTAQIFHRRTE